MGELILTEFCGISLEKINLLIKPFPKTKADDAMFLNLSSALMFEKNSPFPSENFISSEKRKVFNSSLPLILGCVSKFSKYFFNFLFLNSMYYSPYMLMFVQKFFSGNFGIIEPPYFSSSFFSRYSKSLNLLLTQVS